MNMRSMSSTRSLAASCASRLFEAARAPGWTTCGGARSAAARCSFASGNGLPSSRSTTSSDPARARARSRAPCATGRAPSVRCCGRSRTPARDAGRRAPPCRGSTSRGSSPARRQRGASASSAVAALYLRLGLFLFLVVLVVAVVLRPRRHRRPAPPSSASTSLLDGLGRGGLDRHVGKPGQTQLLGGQRQRVIGGSRHSDPLRPRL